MELLQKLDHAERRVLKNTVHIPGITEHRAKEQRINCNKTLPQEHGYSHANWKWSLWVMVKYFPIKSTINYCDSRKLTKLTIDIAKQDVCNVQWTDSEWTADKEAVLANHGSSPLSLADRKIARHVKLTHYN